MTKWQFLVIFLKRVENDPFLRLQMRAKEDFNAPVVWLPLDLA